MNTILLNQIYGHGCFLLNNIPRSSQPGLLTGAGRLEGVPIGAPLLVLGLVALAHLVPERGTSARII